MRHLRCRFPVLFAACTISVAAVVSCASTPEVLPDDYTELKRPQERMEVPLGEIGTLHHRAWMMVSPARLASLIELVFDVGARANGRDVVPFPEVEVYVINVHEFQVIYCREASGSAWRQCLKQVRSESFYGLPKASYDPDAARDNKLILRILYPPTDSSVAHECFHYITQHQSNDPVLYNNHTNVEKATEVFMSSHHYREWLQERPWLQ